MHYLRHGRIRVYPRVRWLPFRLVWWVVLLYGWALVWTVLWCWEAFGPAGVRAARTTKRLLGWPR